jgi:phosphoribosylformimino-5-aminoimidazole carboxamide ribotide isomerase
MNLHIVDLDGAKSGKTINYDIIAEIRNSYPDIYMQIGGGIRDIESINKYINIGINKVIVGTRVVSDPSFLKSIPSDIKEKVIIDLAVKDGKLAVHGWNNSSDFTLQDFVKILESNNIQEIVFTDVSKDGMLEGMNFLEISNILSFSSIPLIASGGVTSIDDIKYLCGMNEIKISGVIIGKALYENKINLKDAIKLSNKN